MKMRKPRKHEWKMSFASMSDIAFLLIIFFIVAGHFTQTEDYEVSLPGAESGERSDPKEIHLVVMEDRFIVNGTEVHQDFLDEEVSFYIFPDAPREQKTVIIYADRDAPYGRIAIAVEAVNQADAYLELAIIQE